MTTSKITSSDSSSIKKQKKSKSQPSPPNPPKNPQQSPQKKPLDPNPPKSKDDEPPRATDKMTASPEPPSKKSRSNEKDDGGDSLTILEAVIKFRQDHHGANPTPTNMQPLYNSIKDSLLADLTLDKLYNRIRHLRTKYYKLRDSGRVLESPADRAFLELSDRAWDRMTKNSVNPTTPEDEAMEDIDAGSLVWVNQQAKEYWELMGMSSESLELGLKAMDKGKAKALEKKWEHHGEAWLKIQAKQSEIEKELFVALAGALKVTKD